MPGLPTGLVTYLMTDIEGSTEMWERDTTGARAAIAEHDRIVADAVEANAGVLLRERGEGDSWFAVFVEPADAVAAAAAIQQGLVDGPVRVRIGIHTGDGELVDGTYYGVEVNRCARVRSAGHGGQVLLTAATAALVTDAPLRDLGSHRLRGLSSPEHIFQLQVAELDQDFPPLVTLDLADRLRRSLSIRAAPSFPAGSSLAVEVGTRSDGQLALEVMCDGAVAETFTGLSPADPDAVVREVNGRSQLIRLSVVDPFSP